MCKDINKGEESQEIKEDLITIKNYLLEYFDRTKTMDENEIQSFILIDKTLKYHIDKLNN